MTDYVKVTELIRMLQREVETGNGDKYVKIPKIKFADIETTKFSADIGIVYGDAHDKGDCILLIGD